MLFRSRLGRPLDGDHRDLHSFPTRRSSELAAGHRHRVYDAVILKTLGATRARLLGAYALEYLMIGFATAIFGVIAGSVAAWLIVTRLMTLSFVWQAGSAAGVVAAALIVTVGLGLAGTLLALNQKPATVLRNL